MSSISVRKATSDDVAFILASNQNMAAETEDITLNAATLRSGIEYLLGHADEGLYLLAEYNGQQAGTLMLTFEWSDWRSGRFWWIQSVYVPLEFRRHGIYRAMHEAVRALARQDPQACGLRLYVERDNHAAQQVYQHMGMEQTHYQMYEETLQPG